MVVGFMSVWQTFCNYWGLHPDIFEIPRPHIWVFLHIFFALHLLYTFYPFRCLFVDHFGIDLGCIAQSPSSHSSSVGILGFYHFSFLLRGVYFDFWAVLDDGVLSFFSYPFHLTLFCIFHEQN